ncbi:MAG: DUF1801 domain-containing protein [Thermaerobacterales bacterium]
MQSSAVSVEEYLASLLDPRRSALTRVRSVILQYLPDGYEESMQYGMITYAIPLSRYPSTYNKQPLAYISLASQKQYMSLYLMGIYGDAAAADWFQSEYRQTGKKLDMGKSCVRFKKIEDLPLDLIGKAVAMHSVDDLIESYERSGAAGS